MALLWRLDFGWRATRPLPARLSVGVMASRRWGNMRCRSKLIAASIWMKRVSGQALSSMPSVAVWLASLRILQDWDNRGKSSRRSEALAQRPSLHDRIFAEFCPNSICRPFGLGAGACLGVQKIAGQITFLRTHQIGQANANQAIGTLRAGLVKQISRRAVDPIGDLRGLAQRYTARQSAVILALEFQRHDTPGEIPGLCAVTDLFRKAPDMPV